MAVLLALSALCGLVDCPIRHQTRSGDAGFVFCDVPRHYHHGERFFPGLLRTPVEVLLWLDGLGRFSRSSCQISEPRCIVRNSAPRAFHCTGDSSSGRTTDSGSVWRGSNPLSPAIQEISEPGIKKAPFVAAILRLTLYSTPQPCWANTAQPPPSSRPERR
jgi:hypothetical protein